MSVVFEIADLRQCPEFFDAVADRIWRAWWKPRGHPLEHLRTRLGENLGPAPIPSALVAHAAGNFLGTASVVAADLAERPQYTPWVAAVWVEPSARRRGIAAALVDRAAQTCFAFGIDRIYLCARIERAAFYERLGWRIIERNVGTVPLDVFIRDGAALSRSPP
jgi:GNAT superfamily N-acetyltransferase